MLQHKTRNAIQISGPEIDSACRFHRIPESLQFICEVAILLLIIVAFAVVGLKCARILCSRFKPAGVDAGYDTFMGAVGSRLRLHMAGTTALVFVTFLLRAVFSTMQLVA